MGLNIMPPEYTQVPNELLDNLSDFSKVEIIILMVLCRLTFGFHRESVTASNARIARMGGIAVSTVIRNAKVLEEKGLITKRVGPTGFSEWSVVLQEPTKKPKKKPGKKEYTPEQESMYAKAQALAEVCQMDFEANKGMLLGNAKRLKDLTADEIRDLFGEGGAWYRLDFRGKKGSPPAIKQIGTEYLKLRKLEQQAGDDQDLPSDSVVKDGELYA